MSFKIPLFNVPQNKTDNPLLFNWMSLLFGRWSSTELVLERVVSIGDWDMDSTASVTVEYKTANDILDFKRIRSVQVLIINDAEDTTYDAGAMKDALDSIAINTTNITLTRTTSGFFDGTGYNSTSITTRGYVTIRYIT